MNKKYEPTNIHGGITSIEVVGCTYNRRTTKREEQFQKDLTELMKKCRKNKKDDK